MMFRIVLNLCEANRQSPGWGDKLLYVTGWAHGLPTLGSIEDAIEVNVHEASSAMIKIEAAYKNSSMFDVEPILG